MKSGAAFLLAILLGILLAYGSFGSGSSDDYDSNHSNSASSSDDHDDSSKDDDEDEKASDKDDSDKDSNDTDDSDKDSNDTDSNDKDSNEKDSSDKDSSYADGMKQRLENEGLHVEQSSATSDDQCAAHTFGEVSTYFQEHPCNGLDRAWYEVSDDGGNTAIVSVAWVEMPDANSAAELQTLVDRPGTGNVTELSKEDGPYRSVSYGGWYYRSGRDGDTFSSIQAEPLTDSDGSREVARRASGAAGTD